MKTAAAALATLALAAAGAGAARANPTTVTGTVSPGSPLAVATPATTSFGVTLNGADQTSSYALPLTVTDPRGSGGGWNVTIAATQFSDGSGHTFPAAASTVTAVTPTCSTGSTCTLPTNAVGYPLAISASAVKAFNAAANTGLGKVDLAATVSVAVPANVFAGSYTSTVTVTIVAGP